MKKKKLWMFIIIAIVNLLVLLSLYIFVKYYMDDFRMR